MASSDVMRPSNLIQQAPYIHHPSILYGNPPGIASGSFVSPVPVVPAVVAPPLQTQLHHGCGMMVVSHATPNGNPVNCQNNMESQGGCVQWVCLVRGEGVSVPGRASYPGMSKCGECRCVNEEYNAECVNWLCECVGICQVCKTIMYCNDVGISGAVGVLVVCVSVCWVMSGGVSVLWCVSVFAGVCQGVSVSCGV